MPRLDQQRVTAGLTLIAVGLGLFVLRRVEGIGTAAVLFLVGAAFLASYLYSRRYGLLVPAGVLLGLGAGMVGGEWSLRFGHPVLLGLGAGFLLIFFVALMFERRSHWWPLVPGTVLLLVAVPNTKEIVEYFFDNWPLLLVASGVIVLVGGVVRRRVP